MKFILMGLVKSFTKEMGRSPNVGELKLLRREADIIQQQDKIIPFPQGGKDKVSPFKPRPQTPKIKQNLKDNPVKESIDPKRIKGGISTKIKLNSFRENQQYVKDLIGGKSKEFNTLKSKDRKEILDQLEAQIKKDTNPIGPPIDPNDMPFASGGLAGLLGEEPRTNLQGGGFLQLTPANIAQARSLTYPQAYALDKTLGYQKNFPGGVGKAKYAYEGLKSLFGFGDQKIGGATPLSRKVALDAMDFGKKGINLAGKVASKTLGPLSFLTPTPMGNAEITEEDKKKMFNEQKQVKAEKIQENLDRIAAKEKMAEQKRIAESNRQSSSPTGSRNYGSSGYEGMSDAASDKEMSEGGRGSRRADGGRIGFKKGSKKSLGSKAKDFLLGNPDAIKFFGGLDAMDQIHLLLGLPGLYADGGRAGYSRGKLVKQLGGLANLLGE